MTTDPPAFLEELPLTREALAWAAELHRGQRRDSDAALFVLHPLEVAMLLTNRGFADEVSAAALLHDVVEDTGATVADVEARFGARIAGMIADLSDDPAIEDYAERKAALRAQVARAGAEAQAIYAADKVAKARELRAEAARNPSSLADPQLQRRFQHYESSLEMLEAEAPDQPLVRQLRFELWALRNLPPSS